MPNSRISQGQSSSEPYLARAYHLLALHRQLLQPASDPARFEDTIAMGTTAGASGRHCSSAASPACCTAPVPPPAWSAALPCACSTAACSCSTAHSPRLDFSELSVTLTTCTQHISYVSTHQLIQVEVSRMPSPTLEGVSLIYALIPR